MFIFLNRTCFNGLHRVNSKGHFNVPFGKYANPTICDENLIMEDSSLLQNVEILCGDYTQIERFIDKNSFIYFDPPYRPLSSTSSFTSYAKEDFGDVDQVRLAQFFARLSRCGCKMMLSNSDCKGYNPMIHSLKIYMKTLSLKEFMQCVMLMRILQKEAN